MKVVVRPSYLDYNEMMLARERGVMSLPFLVKSNLNKTFKNESPSCPLANDHRLTQRMDLYIPRPLVSGWNAQLRTLHNFARADALDRPRPLLSFAVDSTNFTGN